MTIEVAPDPGRPVMTAREASRLLRKDPRTIKRMIENGELTGGAQPGAQRRQWYVYADQFTQTAAQTALPPPVTSCDVAVDRDRLLQENLELRAELISTREAYRLVLASQATTREALADYQRSVDEILAGANAFRDAATHFQSAVTGLQSSNSKLNEVAGAYSDALHQNLVPGHPGSLDGDLSP